MAYPGAEEHTEPQIVTTQQSRQGEATGHVRYVLASSLVLAAVAGVVLYIYFTM